MSHEAPAGARCAGFPNRGLPRRIHALGAGGAGVSAALQVLLARGHALSGVDATPSEHVELLRSLGIDVRIERAADAALPLPSDVELVLRSAAIPDAHPLVEAARARGIPVAKYGEVLAALCPPGRTLAVAGTHGKTTTSWMTQHALARLARALGAPEPGAIVGGVCRLHGTNAKAGRPGGWFTVEACEYDRTFLGLAPYAAAITNVEPDHLDYYGTFAAVVAAFEAFAARIERAGLLVLGPDVPTSVEAAAACPVWRLGRELEIELCGEERGRFHFALRGPFGETPELALGVPGAFNVTNAACALALALGVAGGPPAAAAEGLAGFMGVKRRFEPWGEPGGIAVVHDYAHHPTELACTLEAARRVQREGRLHVLFQPHQHSRTARFLDDFIESLLGVDRVVVADVYGARAHIDKVTAGAPELVRGLTARGVDALAGGSLSTSVQAVACAARAGDLVLVVGAGDVESIRTELLDALALRSPSPGRALR